MAVALSIVPLLNAGVIGANAAALPPPSVFERSGPDPFAHPPDLERDVRFWIRVYTEVTTDQGLLHDDRNLGLVYEVLRFDPGDSPSVRERRVTAAKLRYGALLRRFAGGDLQTFTGHERRILHAFGEAAPPGDFRDAISRVRFQLGQANRFHEGLIRAAAWEPNIARTLVQHGVPPEIAALPHVESSFNLAAYSKVGAAGLWQFMPGTARRFMRVDSLVDERLDPYSATEAAANLMLYNFRLLGTWPLAVTAYNHGPGGLRRAQDELGTSDIAVIVQRYQGATFGFASRNFYVAFLAALEVDRNAERYFGPLTRLPNTESTPVELPDYIAVEAIAAAFRIDLGALRVLNPALRPPIWSGNRLVPRGYKLRVPGTAVPAETAAAWQRLLPSQRFLAQRGDAGRRLRRGETLTALAAANNVSLSRLLAFNGWNGNHPVARGEWVQIPMPASRAETTAGDEFAARRNTPPAIPAARPAAPLPAPVAAAMPAPGTAVVKLAPVPKEPVSERQIERTSLLPVAAPTGNSDATDYGVRPDNTVIVQAAETIGHYSDWSGIDRQTLRTLNKIRDNGMMALGRRFKLDLSAVTAAQFVAVRRAYHKQLQDAFFATHRIAATENYAVRRGDSLWTIAQRSANLPVWLVAQYNPDMDVGNMRPGAVITLPQVVSINRQ